MFATVKRRVGDVPRDGIISRPDMNTTEVESPAHQVTFHAHQVKVK